MSKHEVRWDNPVDVIQTTRAAFQINNAII